ncbi:MAG: hypothetical protein LBM00_10930, partial [Deltaproteobacteria bacterium]|nr:hypothetical protein [Deltaproteobacteria bacterium]
IRKAASRLTATALQPLLRSSLRMKTAAMFRRQAPEGRLKIKLFWRVDADDGWKENSGNRRRRFFGFAPV